MAEGQQIDIRTLQPEQLQQLRQNLLTEISNFENAIKSFEQIKQKYKNSADCISEISKPNTDSKELLVPITSSMYVPGKLVDSDKVLLDIGTGYYAEKNRSDAEEFCNRKMKMLEENIAQIKPVLEMRHISIRNVEEQMVALSKAAMKAQASAGK